MEVLLLIIIIIIIIHLYSAKYQMMCSNAQHTDGEDAVTMYTVHTMKHNVQIYLKIMLHL